MSSQRELDGITHPRDLNNSRPHRGHAHVSDNTHRGAHHPIRASSAATKCTGSGRQFGCTVVLDIRGIISSASKQASNNNSSSSGER